MAQDARVRLIESLLQRYGLSNRWLAKQLGVNHTSVNDWLDPNGGRPRNTEIYDRMMELLQKQGPPARQIALARAGVRIIPVYSKITAGKPQDWPAGDVQWEEVLDWGSDFQRWGRPIEGESMLPILEPEDIAIFEDRKWETGDVVHAALEQERDVVKALRGAELHSFNEDFEPFPVAGWTVKGVCVGRIRYGRYKTRSVTDFPGGLKWSMRNENL